MARSWRYRYYAIGSSLIVCLLMIRNASVSAYLYQDRPNVAKPGGTVPQNDHQVQQFMGLDTEHGRPINGQPAVDNGQAIDKPVVDTIYGTVHGMFLDEARAFLGIPYAAPPVGDLRWANPQEPQSWDEPKDATKHAMKCPQMPYNETKMSEDCLYLDVYTPVDANPASNYPVIVSLHGGFFTQNSNSDPKFDGRFLANSSLVVVVPNFRLGALGFLYTGQDTILGNFAIRDQQAALKFVQQNIAVFGGNPNKVTLMGQSSGAECVAVHLMSPHSESLFHQAIMISIYFPGTFREADADAPVFGKNFARLTGCITASSACLRKVSFETILTIQTLLLGTDVGKVDGESSLQMYQRWSPVVDGDLVPMQFVDAFLESAEFQYKPMIIGVSRDDARPFVYVPNQEPMNLPDYLQFILDYFPPEKAARVVQKYPPDVALDNRDTLGVALTDFTAICSSRLVGHKAWSSNVPIFHYIFDNPLPDNFPSNWDFCDGYSCHNGDGLYWYHTGSLQNHIYNETEEILADSMLYYWANFAYTGNPDDDGWRTKTRDFPTWPPYSESNGWPSMRFMQPNNDLFLDYRSSKCNFWDDIGYSAKSSLTQTQCTKTSPVT